MEFFTPDKSANPDSLGLALVLCSNRPLVLLDSRFVVRAASGSFCRAFGLDPHAVTGKELFALGAGEWDLPRLRSLLNATLSGAAAIEAYELNLVRSTGLQILVLNVQLLDYSDTEEVCLVLAMSDVTAARAAERHKDDLVRDNQTLLRELQHRVANSLQIIASVLMQSARKVQSDEARTHLHDAHHRVLSIAMLQKQLAGSAAGDVALRPYLTDLCRSIGASMIGDPGRIRITPQIAEATAAADASVSLGLILTELIINSLKHAFPDDWKGGNIAVDYMSDGADWSLTVADDGLGRGEKPVPGLGTGIVEALAKQLKASVEIRDAHPGTLVAVTHHGAGGTLTQ